MEESFLEFELDFFRNFFSTAGEDENDFNNSASNHQKSILSPYSIGICLCYLVSMIKSNKIREKVAKELIGFELKDFQRQGNITHENPASYNSDLLIKEVFKLISEVENHKNTLSSSQEDVNSNLFINQSSISSIQSRTNENIISKRKFYSANLVFSVKDPHLLSPESELLQNSEFVQRVDYAVNPVYKLINKTVKKLTFGNIKNLMNPLMHFTDNSLALSSLLYFEDSFHEENCFDSIEVHIFHTFSSSSRRRKSTMSGPKPIKCLHSENQNLCLSCLKNEKLISSSQSFTSLYQHTVSNVKVQMMKMTGKRPLCNDKSKNYFSIELPTSDKQFSLVCIIPRYRGEESFSNMIQNMTYQEYRSILDNMEPSSYDICLPFFSFETESFDLISPITDFESDKIFLYNNKLSSEPHSQLSEEEHNILDQGDSKKKKKAKKDKKKKDKKDKKKKKSLSRKSLNKSNNDESNDDNSDDMKQDSNIVSDVDNGNNNHDYFYCPHCGARKLRNESMIGEECMIKNIKLNEDAFLHHFRQKCCFSVNLNGIGQQNSSNTLPRSASTSSLSSNSSISSQSTFDQNAKIGDYDTSKEKLTTKDLKSKGKEKKKKDIQPKKIFDHPFIFFLTRRKPDIIIQYGVVTLPTLQDESFLSI